MRRILVAAVLTVALSPSLALAKAMTMIDSHPKAQEIVDGNNAQYSVRFDGPVDHRQALLSITGTDGKTISNLRPLLDSASNVLFASGTRLQAGDYQLHWVVRSIPDGDITSGYVPFKVKQ
jgi:methionine-rich copper-binding protein CopC